MVSKARGEANGCSGDPARPGGRTTRHRRRSVALLLVTVQAQFEVEVAQVRPGDSVSLRLSVTNLGDATETCSLSPTGLAASWTTITPASITLFAGSQQTVVVQVSPPRLPSTTAGPTALGVRVVPLNEPDEVEHCEIGLDIAVTTDRRVTVLQPVLRGRRRAVYELLVENRGNSQANCTLYLIDPTGRLDGRFDPPATGVEPGGSSLVRLKLTATRRHWERRSRTLPFRVDADEPRVASVSADASFVQAPMLPERLGSRLAGLVVAAGLVVLAWAMAVRPAIDEAARRAVDDIAPVASVTPVVPTDSAPEPTDTASTDEGEPFSTVLTSGGPAAETSSQSYTVPDGMVLLVTDYVVQNPFADSGIVRLRLGERELQWDLSLHLDGTDVVNRLLTPVAIAAGEAAVFEVDCAEVGRVGSASCSATALVAGRLVEEPSDAG